MDKIIDGILMSSIALLILGLLGLLAVELRFLIQYSF
jgi:hypothetical protein